jgi:hypothetical protein
LFSALCTPQLHKKYKVKSHQQNKVPFSWGCPFLQEVFLLKFKEPPTFPRYNLFTWRCCYITVDP